MLFTEFRFFAFFALIFVAYWSLRNNKHRKILLLAGSYFFYAAWDYRFVSLIVFSTIVDYVIGLRLETAENPRTRKQLVTVSLVANLGLLAIFKYFNFFAESFARLANSAGLTISDVTLEIVLPVGISFYTFQTLSYSLDVYRRRLRPTHSIIDFATYVAFFPQLVAGPIVRASEFLPQLLEIKFARQVDWRWALSLFLVGFIKKACIADNLAPFVDLYYAAPGAYSMLTAWTAVVAYSVQIYCDFSGYSDMAIATAAMLGFRLCDNFRAPYLSPTIKAFWQRWHISLSSWLRDYLYISLGGNRKGIARTRLNLMLTMLLGGLWHGAGWNFIAWGAAHGMALVAYDLWQKATAGRISVPPAVGIFITFIFVTLLWVTFRAASFEDTLLVWSTLLPGAVNNAALEGDINTQRVLILLGIAATLHFMSHKGLLIAFWRNAPAAGFALGYGVLWSAALLTRSVGYAPFIYFQF